jgi:hypothetical protein
VRTRYQTRIAFDLARQYRDTVVPLRKQISEEDMLRYNGMLISVFELPADARELQNGSASVTSALLPKVPTATIHGHLTLYCHA